jgi:hypothetical protein
MELLKIIYALVGAPFPISSLVIMTMLGAFLFGGGWWAIGKQSDKEREGKKQQAISTDTAKTDIGTVAPVNQTGVVAGVINGNVTVNPRMTAEPQKSPEQKPKFMLLMNGGNVFMPNAPDMHDHLTGIALNAKIWNIGTPSVATEWSLRVTPKGKPPINAQFSKIPDALHLNGPINSTVIKSDDALDEKTKTTQIQNIPVEGTLLFYVQLPKETVMDPSTKLELKVKDIYGRESSAVHTIGDWLSR